MQLLVEATGVAHGKAVAVSSPQRGRVRLAVDALDARLLHGGLLKKVTSTVQYSTGELSTSSL